MEDWLKLVDKCGLPGKFKAWIYQHGILPRLLWPLLVYSVPSSTMEAMERTINSFLRRWKGVPKSFTSLGLYFTGSKLQVPLKSLTEEYKVTKARQIIMLRDSVVRIRTRKSAPETASGKNYPVSHFIRMRTTDGLHLARSGGRVKKYYCRTFSTINF